jgi:hypothetical protein
MPAARDSQGDRPDTSAGTLTLSRELIARSRDILDDMKRRLEAGPEAHDAPAEAGPCAT